MEYIVDYEFKLKYHPGKENVVTDGLSRKDRVTLERIMVHEWRMLKSIIPFDPDLKLVNEKFQLCGLVV